MLINYDIMQQRRFFSFIKGAGRAASRSRFLPIFLFRRQRSVFLSYWYQLMTLSGVYASRYRLIYSFRRLPGLQSVFFRFSEVTASIEHMVYLTSRVGLVNLPSIKFRWTDVVRAKSRRWQRKFVNTSRRLLGSLTLPKERFVNFWQTFIVIYLSHYFREGVGKRTGAGPALSHWFRKAPMYWEYPYLWPFFSSNLTVHYELFNFFIKLSLTAVQRPLLMVDRDFWRFLNFPILMFNLPRLWQPDPAKYVLYLRVPHSP